MTSNSGPIITATVSEFCRISGIGRSRLYELLAADTLASIKIGKRRLILIDSYRRLIDQQRSSPAETRPTAGSCNSVARQNGVPLPIDRRRPQSAEESR